MVSYGLKIISFRKNRHRYPYETQVLALVLYNYTLLGLVSLAGSTLFLNHAYSYTWPQWFLTIWLSLALLELALRSKSIKLVKDLVLIIPTL